MTTRAEFLDSCGWGAAQGTPLAGDASARRYERLTRGTDTAILMLTRPGDELERFIAMTAWMLAQGFSAPRILAEDRAAGLLLLEDLGDDLVARLVTQDPSREAELYDHVTDFLLALHAAPPPALAPLDGPALAELTALLAGWYPGEAAMAAIPGTVAALWAALDDGRRATCLRDFHAENALWLPGRTGVARMGVLDYQDAVLAHPAYDLVSALQDARRDVSPATETRQIARYVTACGADPDGFSALYALLGAQRALRILAVFARLCLHFGKPGYLAFMPRVWGLLQRNLAHPALAPLRTACAGLHAPTPQMIKELERQCATRPTP